MSILKIVDIDLGLPLTKLYVVEKDGIQYCLCDHPQTVYDMFCQLRLQIPRNQHRVAIGRLDDTEASELKALQYNYYDTITLDHAKDIIQKYGEFQNRIREDNLKCAGKTVKETAEAESTKTVTIIEPAKPTDNTSADRILFWLALNNTETPQIVEPVMTDTPADTPADTPTDTPTEIHVEPVMTEIPTEIYVEPVVTDTSAYTPVDIHVEHVMADIPTEIQVENTNTNADRMSLWLALITKEPLALIAPAGIQI